MDGKEIPGYPADGKEWDEDLEVTERSSEKGRYLFVLNHSDVEKQIKAPESMKDIISGTEYVAGDMVNLKEKDVKILKEIMN